MKTLHFYHAGKHYACSLAPGTLGHVVAYGEHTFNLPNPSWAILGVSRHHWCSTITTRITPDVNPKDLEGGLVWDKDHGAIRQWSGRYAGKLPRVTQAWITE